MPQYGRPRQAEGGIKARGGRGTIGAEWWSRRFIDVMESFADKNRMGRGRTYARKGQVLELNVRPYEVNARVQGSEEEPYVVTIGINAIPDETWEAIEAEIASRAVFRAKLLSGEMPAEIEDLFAGLGTPLFPSSSDDLHMMCDCLDWGYPCKHVAAVLYVLAEAFDRDPFLILAWNGRTRDQLRKGLRRRPAAEADATDVEDTPLTATDFWTPASGLARLRERPPRPKTPPGLLMELLDPPKVKVRRRDLVDLLAPVYEALARLP